MTRNDDQGIHFYYLKNYSRTLNMNEIGKFEVLESIRLQKQQFI